MTDTAHPFDDLLAALADGLLPLSDGARLADRLRGNVALQDAYLSYTELHAMLAWDLTKAERGACSVPSPDLPPAALPRRSPRIARFTYALVAAVLITACGVAFYLAGIRGSAAEAPASALAPVATLTDAQRVVWSSDPLQAGDDVVPQTIRTQAGNLDLLLGSGTMVHLSGASDLELRSAMRVSMHGGAAGFTCPPSAVGFTVDLPGGARVVDLGTRFAIRFDEDGRIVVHVIRGATELILPDGQRHVLESDARAWLSDGRVRLAAAPVPVPDVRDAVDDSSEAVRILDLPPARIDDHLHTDENVLLIPERRGVTLRKGDRVSAIEPGEYAAGTALQWSALPADAIADSFLLHFRPTDWATTTATVTFARPIVAVIAADQGPDPRSLSLRGTDATFGAAGARYASPNLRGLDDADRFSISDDRLSITLQLTARGADQVRVLLQSHNPDQGPSPTAHGDKP